MAHVLERMRVKDMVVEPCDPHEIADFIETWHYSKNVHGVVENAKYCFKLTYDERLIGAAIFGRVAMANVWRKYAESEDDILELRRLACIDDTPKNTESYFIGRCLRWLKKNTDIKTIISYADEEYGHKGIIYRAANFEYVGMTQPGRVIIWNGKRYHDRTIRNRRWKNGKRTDELAPIAIQLTEALKKGEAYWHKTPGKHIYKYDLRRK